MVTVTVHLSNYYNTCCAQLTIGSACNTTDLLTLKSLCDPVAPSVLTMMTSS